MNVQDSILRMVQADAQSQLQRAMEKQRHYDATRALKAMVEASLPDRHMPGSNIDTVYRKTSGPHVAWKWVTARGVLVLLAEIPRESYWTRIVLTAFVDYPGLSRPKRMIYRDETEDIRNLPSLVAQAVRQFDGSGL